MTGRTRAITAQARHALKLAAMYALRYTPIPWRVKHHAVRQFMPKAIIVGLAIIPDDSGRVLMLRARYSGLWILPGGAIEAGEDPLSGTLRECREEMGAAVTIERLTGIYSDRHDRELLIAFRCRPLEAPPVLSEEHEAWRYLPPAQIRAPVDAIVRDALCDTATVHIRRLVS